MLFHSSRPTSALRAVMHAKFLYASRALLACRWIRQYKSQPPTEFQTLVDEVASADERIYFGDLVARKSETPEKGEIVLEQSGREAITAELENYERDATSLEASPRNSLQQLDTAPVGRDRLNILNWMELDGQMEVTLPPLGWGSRMRPGIIIVKIKA